MFSPAEIAPLETEIGPKSVKLQNRPLTHKIAPWGAISPMLNITGLKK